MSSLRVVRWALVACLGVFLSAGPTWALSSDSVLLRGSQQRVAAGGGHTCAILSDGVLRCWGSNSGGQLGLGSTATTYGRVVGESPAHQGSVVAMPGGRRAVSVAAGSGHTCVVLDDGELRCWGRNASAQLGRGPGDDYGNKPGQTGGAPGAVVTLPAGRRAVSVATGSVHTCVVLDDGQLRCWGRNGYGQLGHASSDQIFGDAADELPAADGAVVPLPARAVAVATGFDHTCVVLVGGELRCWGNGQNGVLGRGTSQAFGNGATERTDGPAAVVDVGGPVESVSAAGEHTCVIVEGGVLRCWGSNEFGQLVRATALTRYGALPGQLAGTPETVIAMPGQRRAVTVTGNDRNVCVVLDDGQLRCWGRGELGQLGHGSTDNYGRQAGEYGGADGAVMELPAGARTRAIAAGAAHICAVTDEPALRCWGQNPLGELGHEDTEMWGDGSTLGLPPERETPGRAGALVPLPAGVGPVVRSADVSVTIAGPVGAVIPGAPVGLSVQVRNAGPDAAQVSLRPELGPLGVLGAPAGASVNGSQWGLGSLAPGASKSVDLLVRAPAVGVYPVAVQVSESSQVDPDSSPGNDLAFEDDHAKFMVTATVAGTPPPPCRPAVACEPRPVVRPRSKILRPSAGKTGKKIRLIAGSAFDADRVEVSIVRKAGRGKQARCLAIAASRKIKRFKTKPDGRCGPRYLLSAKGTSSWKLRLDRPLPRGKWIITSRAIGASGLTENIRDTGNRHGIRIR